MRLKKFARGIYIPFATLARVGVIGNYAIRLSVREGGKNVKRKARRVLERDARFWLSPSKTV